MKRVNRVITAALALTTVSSCCTLQAAYASLRTSDEYKASSSRSEYAKDKNDINWEYQELKNGTIKIVGTEDIDDSTIEVPEKLDGMKVSIIESIVNDDLSTSKYNKLASKIKKIILPSSTKIIENDAFFNCNNLKNIEMPDDVEVLKAAFSSCPNIKINGKEYSHNSNSNVTINTSGFKTGWNTQNGYKYYMNSNNKLQVGWMDLQGNRYYFYSGGQMATGFIDLGNSAFYYLDPSNGNLQTGWKLINNKWYYFNPTGQGDKERGYMQIAWSYINGSWYYFYSDGTMATGFIDLGGDAFYYLDESTGGNVGKLKTGWEQIGGSWYYFNSPNDGGLLGMMKKGWQPIGGDWYYFSYSDGKMAHDTWIDGYYVNSSGVWVG